ncbi:MAG: agmatine deiminase family protein [Verrucomicrobiota bacterium]|jgi:agmatine deiminase
MASFTSYSQTPAGLGYRMPAEWENQEAVWLSWPHRKLTWPRHFRPIPGVFAKVAAIISCFEEVRINVPKALTKKAQTLVTKAGADMKQVSFYNHPTNDAWCRDHGPIFVKHKKSGKLAVTDWAFNAWGGKYPHFTQDNLIPNQIARSLRLKRFVNPMVLEGGSIDVNGEGLLLTTEACLLNKNRNPDLSRLEIEQNLKHYLGIKKVLWLGEGIVGDDTDGHVDDITRFFSKNGIITSVESNVRDVNYKALRDNREKLNDLRTLSGKPFNVVELPMPSPVRCEGKRLPATYANFLVINGAVLMPSFRQPKKDDKAAEILASCFPDREIVPIDCVELVWGRGTLHCITQQQPAS